MKRTIIVIGGGAAGMFAAVHAARNGALVTLLEKNEKLGKKIYITGKGRCNLTNNSSPDEMMQAITGRAKFMYSAFSKWNAQDTMRFFEEAGLRLKEERGRRIFPVSDHASDVTKTLEREMNRLGVQIRLHTQALEVITEKQTESNRFCAIKICDLKRGIKETLRADACIVATGGLSYPSTGSTGDGYHFAAATGHRITSLSPALVPFEVKEHWASRLQGLSLKNAGIIFEYQKKIIHREKVGELLFTHFGISGPAVLTASSILSGLLYPNGYPSDFCKLDDPEITNEVLVSIDLKPALSEQDVDKRLIRELEGHHRQNFINAVQSLFPRKLIPVIIELSCIDPMKKADQITSRERKRFGYLIKHLTMHVSCLRGWNEAVITHGGVDIREIRPAAMESKKVEGLFFAGEVLNVDAVTGGFNLQIAWSTGYAAGTAAAIKTEE